jgi:two-component system chemotaxis response regulator CheB
VAAAATSTGTDVLAIGVSTGGPAALLEVLRGFPATFPLPILVVIHIGHLFATAFADWLDAQVAISVRGARDGEPLFRGGGGVIMAPADHHLVTHGDRLRLTRDPERHSCRPSIDELFLSLAHQAGARTGAALLTGMGRDGAEGLLAIRRAGGRTIAQDEATSVVYGMPREAVLVGAAERVLSLPEIGPALVALGPPPDQGAR